VSIAVLPVDLGPRVRAGFTLGSSNGRGQNLSLLMGEPSDVVGRRAELAAWAGADVVYVRQVHGAAVRLWDGPPGRPSAALPTAEADALVTTDPRAALAVLVADCVPILLADPDAGVVAAVHAGRRGVVAGVVAVAVAAMREAGAEGIRAVIGPGICGACYEVPAELRAEVAAAVPDAAARTSWGTPALDLPRAVRSQLDVAGARVVGQVGGCTFEDERWFSHRATALGRPAGRFGAVVRLASEGGRAGG
jgi:hypothetical protein